MNKKWKFGKRTMSSAAAVVLGGLVFGTLRLASPAAKLSTAEVKRKEFVDYLEVKGEVKALHSAIITAPYGAGDLQIVKLATNGAKVKKGDLLVEFDNTTMKQKLAQDQSTLKSAEAEIQQSRAAAGWAHSLQAGGPGMARCRHRRASRPVHSKDFGAYRRSGEGAVESWADRDGTRRSCPRRKL